MILIEPELKIYTQYSKLPNLHYKQRQEKQRSKVEQTPLWTCVKDERWMAIR